MGTIRHELPPEPTITAIAAECFIGAAFGLAARVMFSAVHMAGALVALSVGFTGPPGTDDGNGEPQPEIAALISVAALVLMITLDFVGVLLAAFVQSFDAIPLASTTEPGRALDVLTRAAATSVDIAVHISTPFICAGFVINFAFGMVNKLVSQVPVIFISVPFLLAAGLWLLQYSGADLINSAASRLLAPLGGL